MTKRVTRQSVAVVTGGAHGIGAAIAYALSSPSQTVVIVDPGVTIDGAAAANSNDMSIVERIAASGGQARLARISVTDGFALCHLFDELLDEFGHIEAVVNVAGILRPTGFGRGGEHDWQAVLAVHLDGYLNVLRAALPGMVTAGRGQIVGVTSGAGWRQADNGAYGCAKRAVAAITWELGRLLPPGVSLNALSPIAATRMVAGALSRPGGQERAAGRDPSTGAVALGNARPPEDLGGIGALLSSTAFGDAFTGEVVSSNGIEVSRIVRPTLMEIIRYDSSLHSRPSMASIISEILTVAETGQASGGGGTPRQVTLSGDADVAVLPRSGAHVVLVTDGHPLTAMIQNAIASVGGRCSVVPPTGTFVESSEALAGIEHSVADVDAVIVLPGGNGSTDSPHTDESTAWRTFLDEHDGVSEGILADARWTTAVAEASARGARTVTMIVVVDATTAGGRTRGQAAAQLSRGARVSHLGQLRAYAVSLESGLQGAQQNACALVTHLVTEGADDLSGAELVVTADWIGLRAHPHPLTTVTYQEPTPPPWLIDALGVATTAASLWPASIPGPTND